MAAVFLCMLARPSPATEDVVFPDDSAYVKTYSVDTTTPLKEDEPVWVVKNESWAVGENGKELVYTEKREGESGWNSLSSRTMKVKRGDFVGLSLLLHTNLKIRGGISIDIQAACGPSLKEIKWETVDGLTVPERLRSSADEGVTTQCIGSGYVVPANVYAVRLVIGIHTGQHPKFEARVDGVEWRVVSVDAYAAQEALPRLEDVLWLAADTLNQEPLGCYGNKKSWTPTIDGLAAQGRLYKQTASAAPWTRPSFMSMFTGLYPSQHTAEETTSILPEDVLTVAEVMKSKGYLTAGFVLSHTDGYLGKTMGAAQGFDIYVHATSEDEVDEKFRQFIDLNAKAFAGMQHGGLFIFLHMFEPHTPFVNHHPDLIRSEGYLRAQDFSDDTFADITQGKITFSQHDFDYAANLYCWEVNRVDTHLAALFARLVWCGLYDRMNILFTADHGEVMPRRKGSGYVFGHGRCMEEVLRVPLIVRFPGRIEAGGVDDTTMVSGLDVYSTLLDLVGYPAPPHAEGRSLLSATPDPDAPRLLISECRRHGWLSIREGKYKIIVSRAVDILEGDEDLDNAWYRLHDWNLDKPDSAASYALFDIEEDFNELKDIGAEKPEILAGLKDKLLKHCARVGITGTEDSQTPAAQHRELTEQTKEQLENLGYLE